MRGFVRRHLGRSVTTLFYIRSGGGGICPMRSHSFGICGWVGGADSLWVPVVVGIVGVVTCWAFIGLLWCIVDPMGAFLWGGESVGVSEKAMW
jgi:hypothetical protein